MKAQVKKYDPTQYNFENFANTMNKNYAIERSQNSQGGAFGAPTMPGNVAAHADNPIDLGGATNSQTLGNFGFNSILSGFKKSLDGFALGGQVDIQGDKPVLPGNKTPGSVDIASDTTPEETPIETSQLSSSPTTVPTSTPTSTPASTYRPENTAYDELIKMYESGTTDIKELSKLIRRKYDRETVAAALDIFKTSYLPNVGKDTSGEGTGDGSGYLSWLDGIKITATPDLTFEEWQSTYSVDPVQEYKYAQAQLDYEFKTWMSDYGARAEQLYQMGLSNSGISDIYGANAYSAYIQSSMELKREQIKLEQENKKNYQMYLDEKKSAANTRIGTAYAAYEGSYTPEGSQGIYNSLIGQGMSASEAAEVIRRLDAHYNTMPENSRPDTIANEANVNNALNWLNTNYTYGMTDNELQTMLSATYDANVVADALAKFAPFKAVFDRMANDEAAKSAFSDMLELVNAGDTDMESLKQKAKGLGHSDEAIAKAAENIMPFLTEAQNTVNPAIQEAYLSYAPNYTKSMADTIRTNLDNLGWSDEDINTLIGMLNNVVDASEKNALEEIVKDYGTASTNGSWLIHDSTASKEKYTATLVQYKEQYGVHSKEYQTVLAAASASIKDYILNATDDERMLEQAGIWLGVDFAELDIADRISAMLNGAGELHRDGYMTDKDYGIIINEWLENQIAIVKTEEKNAPVTELAGKLKQLQDYKKAGYMNYPLYAELVTPIIDEIKTNGLSNAEGAYLEIGVKDTNAKIKFLFTIDAYTKAVSDDAAQKIKEVYKDKYAGLVYYNGGIYYLYNGEAYSVSKSNISVHDNNKTITNKKAKEMYWDLLYEYIYFSTYKELPMQKNNSR